MVTSMANRDFWKGKRVFITGHTGFKGSWLTLWLEDMGAIVRGYSSGTTDTFSIVLGNKVKSYHFLNENIKDMSKLLMEMIHFAPDIVIHLAAQAFVRKSYEFPYLTYSTNAQGTTNVLQAVNTIPSVKAVLIVTTDKVYANNESGTPFVETDPLGGKDPYSTSKVCAEMITESFKKCVIRKDLMITTVRAGNVIGGGDFSEDRIIPDIIRAKQKGEPIVLRNLNAIRPWQHVLDVLNGYLLVVEEMMCEGINNGPYNFGPRLEDSYFTVSDIVSFFQVRLLLDITYGDKPEAKVLRLNSDKAKWGLGWRTMLTISALNATRHWYDTYLHTDKNMKEFSLEQIHHFEKGAFRD